MIIFLYNRGTIKKLWHLDEVWIIVLAQCFVTSTADHIHFILKIFSETQVIF